MRRDMFRTSLFFWSLATVMSISSSYAGSRVQMAPSETSTVEQFLTACNGNTMLCDDEVRGTFLNKFDLSKTPEICITGAHFQSSVLEWLRAHPEMHQLEREEGIYTAYKTLYPCP
jgi:hypothetical protein